MKVIHAKKQSNKTSTKNFKRFLKLGLVPEVKFNDAEAVKSRNFSAAINQ